jgi:hypothetical protein
MHLRVTLVLLLLARAAGASDKETCIAESETGQRLAIDGKYVESRPHFVACAREACPIELVQDCTAQLAKVDSSIATVVPVARDLATHSIAPNASVEIDGKRADTPDGRSMSVNPGAHVFRFELKSGLVHEERVSIAEGARLVPITASFGEPTRPVPALFWVSATVGAIGLVGLGVFGATSLVQYGAIKRGESDPAFTSDVSTLKTMELLCDVSIGVAVASAVVALVAYVTRPVKPAVIQSGSLRVAPLGLGATF